jgi:hypothetical protein
LHSRQLRAFATTTTDLFPERQQVLLLLAYNSNVPVGGLRDRKEQGHELVKQPPTSASIK